LKPANLASTFVAGLLLYRGKQLDTGIGSVTDKNIADLVQKNEEIVLEIAEVRSSWFGRIFFPRLHSLVPLLCSGGKISPDSFYDLACKYGYGATAGDHRTVRGDFGIGVWPPTTWAWARPLRLTLLTTCFSVAAPATCGGST